MKGLSLIVAMMLVSFVALAEDVNGSGSNEFDGGAPEFQVVKYSQEWIQNEIEQSLQVACKGDRCTLVAVSNKGSDFTVEFNIGEGSGANNGTNGSGNGGVSIFTGGNTNNQNQSQPYVGLMIRYNRYNCTQTVDVPKSLYRSMNTFLYNLVNEDGTPKHNFSPAEQTMIMFYTTIMEKADGCKGN